MSHATGPVDGSLLAEIEGHATEMARGGGAILERYFGSALEVEYKDEKKTDPVTVADKECQAYLVGAISGKYPDHGIVGEEDEEEGDSPAPDLVWVLDPLDGTKNFISGLPVYACSIGVLHRGAPAVGAVYLPWPGEDAGVVVHARSGGGAFLNGERISMPVPTEPSSNRLAGLPASYGDLFRFGKPMRGKAGDLRVTGSIAFELAMVARGVLQFSLFGAPRLWDVAAGAALVEEAGGAVMVGRRAKGKLPLLPPRLQWTPLDTFIPTWKSGTTTLRELRRWSAPLVAGPPPVARYVTDNLQARRRLRRRLGRVLRGRHRNR